MVFRCWRFFHFFVFFMFKKNFLVILQDLILNGMLFWLSLAVTNACINVSYQIRICYTLHCYVNLWLLSGMYNNTHVAELGIIRLLRIQRAFRARVHSYNTHGDNKRANLAINLPMMLVTWYRRISRLWLSFWLTKR